MFSTLKNCHIFFQFEAGRPPPIQAKIVTAAPLYSPTAPLPLLMTGPLGRRIDQNVGLIYLT